MNINFTDDLRRKIDSITYTTDLSIEQIIESLIIAGLDNINGFDVGGICSYQNKFNKTVILENCEVAILQG